MDNKRKAVYSEFERDHTLDEAIGKFVLSLAARIDRMQDLQIRGDLGELKVHALELSLLARKMGYPLLANLCQKLLDSCVFEHHPRVLDTLIELTRLAHRVRLGHRGAA